MCMMCSVESIVELHYSGRPGLLHSPAYHGNEVYTCVLGLALYIDRFGVIGKEWKKEDGMIFCMEKLCISSCIPSFDFI